jgi:hypothetical protein
MMTTLIPLLIAIGIFVCGEFFIPVDPEAPNRKIIRHFWSTTLAVLGLALSFLFSFIVSTEQRLGAVESTVIDELTLLRRSIADLAPPIDAMNQQSERNRYLYEMFIRQSDFNLDPRYTDMLNAWVDESIESLANDIKDGFVAIPNDKLESTVNQLYRGAHAAAVDGASDTAGPASILATNVGSTSSYFGSGNSDSKTWYQLAHEQAYNTHVPVIRFFIYHPNKDIYLGDGTEAEGIDAYTAEIENIHKNYQGLYTAVVDASECGLIDSDKPNDYLFVNQALLLESEVSESDWSLGRVKATARVNNIEVAIRFFNALIPCVRSEFVLPDEDARQNFLEHLDTFQINVDSDGLAKQLAKKLLLD